jgi:CPA1 family monovalent cation:H+ antiporter
LRGFGREAKMTAMFDVVPSLLALSALLVMVSLSPPVARRLNLPYTAVLALFGVALGFLLLLGAPAGEEAAAGEVVAGEGLLGDLLAGLGLIGLSADSLIHIFLPPLLFVGGLGVDIRLLRDEFAAVLLMAVVAVAVCVVMVGGVLAGVSEFSLPVCLLLGAIVAATDPAAVIAIFRDLGAPRRLTTLVSGESLFNDAAAIAIFATLLDVVLRQEAAPAVGEAVASFLLGFAGGLVLGLVMARLAVALLGLLQEHHLAATTISIGLAYASFIIGQDYLQVSGVVAVVAAALTVKIYGPARLPPAAWANLNQMWEQLEFWANSLIFVLAASLAARVLTYSALGDLLLLALLIAATLAARALVLWGLLPALVVAKLVRPISHGYRLVLTWGGLRGAVTLLLALAVASDPRIFVSVRDFVAILATGFVLFTLFVQGPSLRPLIRLLELDKMSDQERSLRDRVIALSHEGVVRQVREVAEAYGLEEEEAEQAVPPAPQISDDETAAGEHSTFLPPAQRLQVGLRILAARERDLLLEQFGGRIVSRRVIGRLLAAIERLEDAAREGGEDGWRRAVSEAIQPSRRMRLALWLQRNLDWQKPLAGALADRIEMLELSRYQVRVLHQQSWRRISSLLGHQTGEALDRLLRERLDLLEDALRAVELQYPDYVRELRRQFVFRTALRFEDAAYRKHLDDNLIGPDLFGHLERDIASRHQRVSHRPELKLGLDLLRMMERVPELAALDEEMRTRLARRLSAYVAFPGERVIRRGQKGTSLYFVASGYLEVHLPDGRRVTMQNGDFFGEIALLRDQPRNADVVAQSFCHLLVLPSRDFRRLLRADPALRRRIEAVAAKRAEDHPDEGV